MNVATSIVSVAVRAQTYKNLLYLLLALPAAMLYNSILTVGFILGMLSLPVLVGIGILVATLGIARSLAVFERYVANRLLAVSIAASGDTLSRGGLRAAVRSCVDSPWTWHALGFLLLRSAVGVLVIVLLFALATAVELLSAPAQYPTTIEFGQANGQPVTWTIDTLPGAVGSAAAGATAVLILLNVSNGVAYASGRMAESLLDTSD